MQVDVEVARKILVEDEDAAKVFDVKEHKEPFFGTHAKGAIYMAKYDGVVPYNELIFYSSEIDYKAEDGTKTTGSWVSNIYVDSVDAQVAGKEVWGLNK